MHLRLMFVLLLILILNTACGKKKSSSNKQETRIDETQIQVVMENQSFECASISGNCPPGISRLLIINQIDPDRSGVCSGFMISPTRLVTNHHCVSTANECANTYIAIYNGVNHEHTKCKSIIRTQQDVGDPNDPSRKLDFTVMEVANAYPGEVFKLSNNLASFGDVIHAWVVDQTGLDNSPENLTDSRITEFECSVMDQSERASLVMLNCPIISGNSGSPALNQNNEVVGIIWGGSASTIDSRLDLDLRRQLDEIALATQVNYFRDFVSILQKRFYKEF